MSEIWMVEGSTGEYSDHREWPVKAFRDKAKAERLVVEAQARANEIANNQSEFDWSQWYDMEEKRHPLTVNEFDPNMQVDSGTHYTCYAVELVED